MQFSCQRSGKCCTHPNIVITLTHEDIWELFQQSGDIEVVKQLIQFLVIDADQQLERLVLHPLQTTDGTGVFILRKNTAKKCIFYNEKESSCEIHGFRRHTDHHDGHD